VRKKKKKIMTGIDEAVLLNVVVQALIYVFLYCWMYYLSNELERLQNALLVDSELQQRRARAQQQQQRTSPPRLLQPVPMRPSPLLYPPPTAPVLMRNGVSMTSPTERV
jgi:hypothetical protein